LRGCAALARGLSRGLSRAGRRLLERGIPGTARVLSVKRTSEVIHPSQFAWRPGHPPTEARQLRSADGHPALDPAETVSMDHGYRTGGSNGPWVRLCRSERPAGTPPGIIAARCRLSYGVDAAIR